MTFGDERWTEFFKINSELNAWLTFLGFNGEVTEDDRVQGIEISRKFEDWRVRNLE